MRIGVFVVYAFSSLKVMLIWRLLFNAGGFFLIFDMFFRK